MGVLAQWCLGSGCVEQNGELQKHMFWLWAWYASRRLSHPTEKLDSSCRRFSRSIRQNARSKTEDEGRRDLGNVVVLGELLEAVKQIVKFARC